MVGPAHVMAVVAWLQPLAAVRSASRDIAEDVAMAGCPDGARASFHYRGECVCEQPAGYCYMRPPGGEMRLGCPGLFSSFNASCDTCVCRPKPEISCRGSSFYIRGAPAVKVMRQGEVVRELGPRDTGLHSFGSGETNKEFLVVAEIDHTPVLELPCFAANSKLCGVGVFTSDRLVCSRLGAAGSRAIAGTVAEEFRAVAPLETERGFGLEFEFVARDLPEDVKERITKDTRGKLKYRLGRMVFGGAETFMEYMINRTFPSMIGYNVDQVTELALGYSYDVLGLQECFTNTTRSPETLGGPCSEGADCALTQYCMDCDACATWHRGRAWGFLPGSLAHACPGCKSRGGARVCRPRSECQEGLPAGGGACPTALKDWAWTLDVSVSPMSTAEAESLGVGEREDQGAGFELVSPPLSGREGARSAAEVLAVLRRMGVQAGRSSGMHVHVNVASEKVPGSKLTVRQIANLWVAFARFQLVIDEMLSPGRPGNKYARGLLMLRGGGVEGLSRTEHWGDDKNCPEDIPCEGAKRFFLQMHELASMPHLTVDFFCNAVLRTPSMPKPCFERYPQQRYYALNLVPLARLGTVEFRAHSATYDTERALHWVRFVVAFVEHFGAGAPDAASPFLDVSARAGLDALAQAQRTATAEELFSSLEGKLDPGARAFYEARAWEEGAPGCGEGARPAPSEPAPANPLLPYMRSLGEQVSVSKESGDDE